MVIKNPMYANSLVEGAALELYAEKIHHHAAVSLAAGEHELTAGLAVDEPFGWGIALSYLIER